MENSTDRVLLYFRRSDKEIIISMNRLSKESDDEVKASIVFHKEAGVLRCYIKTSDKVIPYNSASMMSLMNILSLVSSLEFGDGIINVQKIEMDMEYIKSNEGTVVLEEKSASTT
jgi:hypothetical protein